MRSYFILWKICAYIMLTFMKSFIRLGVKQIIYRKKDHFEILICPLMTFENLLNVSIHRLFKINECARKKKIKSCSFTVLRFLEFQSFFLWGFRGTYVLNNFINLYSPKIIYHFGCTNILFVSCIIVVSLKMRKL